MSHRSKRYKSQVEQLPREQLGLPAAVEKLKSLKSVHFDESVECTLQLGIDPRQADQIVRGSVSLPHGIGKKKKVVAFCEDTGVEAAKEAGAIEAGCDELVEKINGGWMDFDVAVASSKVMKKVGKLGRVLGPQGKMPSPKNGTVTEDVISAVKEFGAGKIEFRNDSGGNIHAVVGKRGFEKEKLVENIESFILHIKRMKPSSSKGAYIKKVCISGTMTPSIHVSL